jgi:hypothetical protein
MGRALSPEAADCRADQDVLTNQDTPGVGDCGRYQVFSRFFWRMVEKSAEGNAHLPCEGSAQYWTEKRYNSIGGYLERAGFAAEWGDEIDKA